MLVVLVEVKKNTQSFQNFCPHAMRFKGINIIVQGVIFVCEI